MKTVIIGDTHLKNIPNQPNYIKAQCDAIREIVKNELYSHTGPLDNVIFLGDVFHNRRPTPTELLAFKDLLNDINFYSKEVFILRGNHESETKADDGITSLSLFAGPHTHIYEHIGEWGPYTFIPHYEHQEVIEKALSEVKVGKLVFGHFGFDGATNSAGDRDFTLKRHHFRNDTYLGHIHHYKQEGSITVVGTPYTTCFQEAGKPNFYGVLDHKSSTSWNFEAKPITWGPKHVIADYDELGTEEWNIMFQEKWKDNYTLLRIFMNELNVTADSKLKDQLKSLYGVEYIDIKFHAIQENKEEAQSNFKPEEAVFQITDDLIEKYVSEHNTSIPQEDIMSGLQELKSED